MTHLHIGVPKTNFVSTLRVFHSFNKKDTRDRPEYTLNTIKIVTPGRVSSIFLPERTGVTQLGSLFFFLENFYFIHLKFLIYIHTTI